MLLSRRGPDLAVTEFQKAIELTPKFPAAHQFGVHYLRLKQYDRVSEELKKAENLGGSQMLEILGSIQAFSGDVEGGSRPRNQQAAEFEDVYPL